MLYRTITRQTSSQPVIAAFSPKKFCCQPVVRDNTAVGSCKGRLPRGGGGVLRYISDGDVRIRRNC